jgi:hypothetical protein
MADARTGNINATKDSDTRIIKARASLNLNRVIPPDFRTGEPKILDYSLNVKKENKKAVHW